MYIKRRLEDMLEPYLLRREVIAIMGPRQSGKTTLLNRISEKFGKANKKIAKLNFENPSEMVLFDDVEHFRRLYSQYDVVCIDEFHFAREGGKKLKLLFDTTDVKWVIAGSSSLELTLHVGKFLVGRMLPFLLLPFSFREYIMAQDPGIAQLLQSCCSPWEETFVPLGGAFEDKLETLFESYVLFGGYPAVVLTQNFEEKKILLRALLDTYLLKDVRGLLQLATEKELLILLKLLAGQIGNLINYQELCASTTFQFRNLKKHLFLLENTYIIELLTPFFKIEEPK